MSRILATTVVHHAQRGERHGGAYIVDLKQRSVHRVIDFRDESIEWYGHEGGRGLRGVAIRDDSVFIAAGHSLIEYDLGFRERGRWQNSWLMNPHGLSLAGNNIYIASTGNDCILAFDTRARSFTWAMHVVSERTRFKAVTFDPSGNDGPLAINKLGLTGVDASDAGLRMSGLESKGLLYFNGQNVTMSVQLPAGAQDAIRLETGALFNDSRSGALRYSDIENEEADRIMSVPFFDPSDHQPDDEDRDRSLRRGYARGLCRLSEDTVAGGFTPAGVGIYSLETAKRIAAVSFTQDVNEAVNSLYALPGD